MHYFPLWKYCTPAHQRAFLLSLRLLGETEWPEEKQLACLYALARHPQRHYRRAIIPKRDGSVRRLSIPDPLLRTVQQNILHHVLDGLSVSPYAKAYRKGLSILDNAQGHVGQRQVLRLDIEHFFDSISFSRVYRSAFSRAYFPPGVAGLLTQLCMDGDRLPQGAPTSAAISNLVLGSFDLQIGAWCDARGITYTRYCDDMTFSGDFSPREVTRKVRACLASLQLTLNEKKTRWAAPCARQIVTGVVVNEKPQAPREYRRSVRQAVYYCQKYGVQAHLAHIGDQAFLPEGQQGQVRYLHSLLGKIGYILQIHPGDAAFLRDRETVKALLAAMEQPTQ